MQEFDNTRATGSGLSRRSFLERIFTATITSAIVPSVLLGQTAPRIATTANSVSGTYTLDLNDVIVLQTVGGSIRLTISEISASFRIIVTRVSETQFEAVNARCPHEGNRVKAREGTNDFLVCEAHDSHFEFDGTYISGPADGKSLTRYTTTFDGTSIVQIEIDALAAVEEAGSRSAYIAIHSTGPLSGQVVFEYALDRAVHVTLAIWSLEGKEVLQPLSAYREAGTYRLPCDVSSLAAGVYLYRLSTPDRIIGSGKLSVQK